VSSDFGDQFNAERFIRGQDADRLIHNLLTDVFDAHNISSVEADEPWDNFADRKAIHQILDYCGIDYLVDLFDEPPVGVNHRTHLSPSAECFDIRAETGTEAPSEWDKLTEADAWDIVPRYASRLKLVDDKPRWFRVVDLRAFVDAVEAGLQPTRVWQDDDSAGVALLYDYDDLRDCGAVVAEIGGGG